jgi:hypothetical protein
MIWGSGGLPDVNRGILRSSCSRILKRRVSCLFVRFNFEVERDRSSVRGRNHPQLHRRFTLHQKSHGSPVIITPAAFQNQTNQGRPSAVIQTTSQDCRIRGNHWQLHRRILRVKKRLYFESN